MSNRIYNDEPCCESVSQTLQGVPTPNQLARNINIVTLNHGYMVEVGCQRFAIENLDKMLKYVGEYLKNPQEVEKSWMSGELKLL